MAWVLDNTQSTAEFSVEHLFVSTVHGQFRQFSADIQIDSHEPSASRVNATILAASLDTGNLERDGQLRSATFLDVEHYPTIEFRSTQVAQMGLNTLWLRGKLTIHGVTRDVILEGHFEHPGAAAAPEQSSHTARFVLIANIDRRDFFDVPANAGGLLIGHTVMITIHASVIDDGLVTTAKQAPRPVEGDER